MNAIDPPATAQARALAARYGTEPKPGQLPWNDVIASLMGHRSVRGYQTTPPPPGTLEILIAAAQSAATSSNLQTWSVMEVTDPEKRKVLAEVANGQKHIIECPIFLVFIADLSRNERLGKAEGATLEVLPYLDAFLVASIDAAMAAQNAVIAAESLGLSTVYIGALRNNVTRVAELLELPSGAGPVFGLCIGYAKPESAGEVKPRLPQEVVLHHDRYSTAGETEARATYDKRLEAFSRRHEMAAYTWTQRVINRMAKLNALTGRDRMKDAFKALGFPLR
ncbi:MAG: NADPH-dependent oxidoreductase [Hyphomicrobium sp.]|nr:NADPH-dependent oxidoreductase [Hyphomicrobium sp.]